MELVQEYVPASPVVAESSSFCEVEACKSHYELKMELSKNCLKDLELEFSSEELTISARIELNAECGEAPRELNFEQRFVLPGVYDGTGIEAFYRGTELHIVVPRTNVRSNRPLCDCPSVYYRPALN
jgi:HSP20 family molecular chaperone IbpA